MKTLSSNLEGYFSLLQTCMPKQFLKFPEFLDEFIKISTPSIDN